MILPAQILPKFSNTALAFILLLLEVLKLSLWWISAWPRLRRPCVVWKAPSFRELFSSAASSGRLLTAPRWLNFEKWVMHPVMQPTCLQGNGIPFLSTWCGTHLLFFWHVCTFTFRLLWYIHHVFGKIATKTPTWIVHSMTTIASLVWLPTQETTNGILGPVWPQETSHAHQTCPTPCHFKEWFAHSCSFTNTLKEADLPPTTVFPVVLKIPCDWHTAEFGRPTITQSPSRSKALFALPHSPRLKLHVYSTPHTDTDQRKNEGLLRVAVHTLRRRDDSSSGMNFPCQVRTSLKYPSYFSTQT